MVSLYIELNDVKMNELISYALRAPRTPSRHHLIHHQSLYYSLEADRRQFTVISKAT